MMNQLCGCLPCIPGLTALPPTRTEVTPQEPEHEEPEHEEPAPVYANYQHRPSLASWCIIARKDQIAAARKEMEERMAPKQPVYKNYHHRPSTGSWCIIARQEQVEEAKKEMEERVMRLKQIQEEKMRLKQIREQEQEAEDAPLPCRQISSNSLDSNISRSISEAVMGAANSFRETLRSLSPLSSNDSMQRGGHASCLAGVSCLASLSPTLRYRESCRRGSERTEHSLAADGRLPALTSLLKPVASPAFAWKPPGVEDKTDLEKKHNAERDMFSQRLSAVGA